MHKYKLKLVMSTPSMVHLQFLVNTSNSSSNNNSSNIMLLIWGLLIYDIICYLCFKIHLIICVWTFLATSNIGNMIALKIEHKNCSNSNL